MSTVVQERLFRSRYPYECATWRHANAGDAFSACHTGFTILLATCFSHASLANILNDSRTYFSRLTKARDHLARQIRKLLLLKGLTASHEVFECWHDEACGN